MWPVAHHVLLSTPNLLEGHLARGPAAADFQAAEGAIRENLQFSSLGEIMTFGEARKSSASSPSSCVVESSWLELTTYLASIT